MIADLLCLEHWFASSIWVLKPVPCAVGSDISALDGWRCCWVWFIFFHTCTGTWTGKPVWGTDGHVGHICSPAADVQWPPEPDKPCETHPYKRKVDINQSGSPRYSFCLTVVAQHLKVSPLAWSHSAIEFHQLGLRFTHWESACPWSQCLIYNSLIGRCVSGNAMCALDVDGVTGRMTQVLSEC